MNTIICPHCNKHIELSQAFAHELIVEKEKLQKNLLDKQKSEFEKIKSELILETEKRINEKTEIQMKKQLEESVNAKKRADEYREELTKANEEKLRLQRLNEERELEMKKTLFTEREKMQIEISKREQEKAAFENLELKKQLDDTKKALEDAQRKSEQKSQQMQGEVFELELEKQLRNFWPEDSIEPVAKGVSGADIKHVVRTTLGTTCGVILWELKRTQAWSDKWIAKLKEDVRNEKANAAIIVSIQLPIEANSGFGQINGVYVCSPDLLIPIAAVIRKNIIDVARQKNIADKRGDKASELYNYVTNHEFQQQVENIVEAYQEQYQQINKERIGMEKFWKVREAQLHRIIISMANIVGSIQGTVGPSMPQIKGLDLLELEDGR